MRSFRTPATLSRLGLYERVAGQAADVVVREYSTSFGLATRLMPVDRRTDIRNIYALVRLADEVVDGVVDEVVDARLAPAAVLTRLEEETDLAVATGYSTNVLVHAFAGTARRAGFGTELTAPFFASMRVDTERSVHDHDSYTAYVYGSSEVIGLMCLRVFLLDVAPELRQERYDALAPGARALGAAFQKINFLRDLADDSGRLGRSYFPGVAPGRLTEDQKRVVLAEIDAELTLAAQALAQLPVSCRRSVAVAYALFAELTRRLEATPAEQLNRVRLRLPGAVKARVIAGALRPGAHGTGA